MTFTEIAKMIHPDLNPGINNPGEKMAIATQNKHNPSFLFGLAVKWGLVKGQSPIYYFSIGNVVSYFNNKRAVIVDVKKMDTHYLIYIINIVESVIKKIRVNNPNISSIGDFRVLGKASESSFVKALYLYGVHQKQKETRSRVVLRPFTNYRGQGFRVWAKTLKRSVILTRTTRKRAYYWDDISQKERFLLFKNVREV